MAKAKRKRTRDRDTEQIEKTIRCYHGLRRVMSHESARDLMCMTAGVIMGPLAITGTLLIVEMEGAKLKIKAKSSERESNAQ